MKDLNYPGKQFYLSHRNKIDTVADVIITKDDADLQKTVRGGNITNSQSDPQRSGATSRNSFKGGKKVGIAMGLKLYHISDSPPCLAVRMGLAYLGLEVELIDIDFLKAEQASDLYKMKNPQGEVPLLDDNGFLLSESVAILQYLGERYKVDEKFYPSDPQRRAIINHRLAFYLSTYYKAMAEYVLLPMCYAYTRSQENFKKVNHALNVFQEFLARHEGNYVAGEELTIADLPLIMGTVLLEVIDFNLTPYPRVKSWYNDFKQNHSDLWALANVGMEELKGFEKNPPDLSQIQHPLHPTDRKGINVTLVTEMVVPTNVDDPDPTPIVTE